MPGKKREKKKQKRRNWFAWYRQWKTAVLTTLLTDSLSFFTLPCGCHDATFIFFSPSVFCHISFHLMLTLPSSPLPSFFLQVRMLESLSWLEQIAEKETEKGRAGEWREKKKEEEHKVLAKEEREKRDGDDGEEKDSDHEDYGWTQQTGKVPGGWGGWMSMRVGKRGVGGQNTLHPTWPSTVKVLWESGWHVDWTPEFMQRFLWFSYGVFLISSTIKFSTTSSSLGSVCWAPHQHNMA